MTSDLVAIARAAYDAYVAKDRAAIEALIDNDFHFTSPIDNRLNRATYFERCWPNSALTEGFDFIHLVPDGDRIFVTYEGRAKTVALGIPNCSRSRMAGLPASRSISGGRYLIRRSPVVSRRNATHNSGS